MRSRVMSGGPAHLGFEREQLIVTNERFCAAMARTIGAGSKRRRGQITRSEAAQPKSQGRGGPRGRGPEGFIHPILAATVVAAPVGCK
jgi:hypothetical protein